MRKSRLPVLNYISSHQLHSLLMSTFISLAICLSGTISPWSAFFSLFLQYRHDNFVFKKNCLICCSLNIRYEVYTFPFRSYSLSVYVCYQRELTLCPLIFTIYRNLGKTALLIRDGFPDWNPFGEPIVNDS